jgi:NAD(P)-dependent dehydrogenase (short-subunit alcohol dehydrogenase family)
MRFSGKSVVITGAASGIGRAAVDLFAADGARILAVDLSDTLADVHAGKDAVSTLRADAGKDADVAHIFAEAQRLNGPIDIICANAGISGGNAGLFEQTADDWHEILRVNLIGAFLAIRYGAKAMIDAGRGGSIVCTASVAGLRAGAGGPAYSASKAGVINLVQTAVQQLSGTGIRVNAVCPGLIETGMTQILFDIARAKGREDAIGQINPLKRGGQPVEIARAIAFLASDEASYINGQSLAVDGGLSSSHPFAKPPEPGKTAF